MLLQLLFINFFLFQVLYSCNYDWRSNFRQMLGSQSLVLSKNHFSDENKEFFIKNLDVKNHDDLVLLTKMNAKLCIYLMQKINFDSNELELEEYCNDLKFFDDFLKKHSIFFGAHAHCLCTYEGYFDLALLKRRFIQILKNELEPKSVVSINKFIFAFVLNFSFFNFKEDVFANSLTFFEACKKTYFQLAKTAIFLKPAKFKTGIEDVYAFGYPFKAQWELKENNESIHFKKSWFFKPEEYFDIEMYKLMEKEVPLLVKEVLKNGSANEIRPYHYNMIKYLNIIVNNQYRLFNDLQITE